MLLKYIFPNNYRWNQSGHTGFCDPFCDKLETISVLLVVAVIYGEVEAKTSIYLDVDKPGTGGGHQDDVLDP